MLGPSALVVVRDAEHGTLVRYVCSQTVNDSLYAVLNAAQSTT